MAKNVQVSRYDGTKLTRHDFPSDFLFGAATSAYQVEGAFATDGKGLSVWDTLSLANPDKIADGSNGSVAIDHYNRFKDDVKLMKKLGIDTYRLSIAWTRILPGGRLNVGINREGVKFYNALIDLLLAEGITPFVTIFHFDTPQALQSEYSGFLNSDIVRDFAEYAEVCFFEFGDRVKHWLTQNEPWTLTINGYVTTGFPPFRGSSSEHPAESGALRHRCYTSTATNTTGGDPSTEPYIVAHNLLLAHARAVDIYRKKYQAVQGGKIGVTNMSYWFDPYDPNDANDVAAAKRAADFMWGWFAAPIATGDYPPIMRQKVGRRLPKFTPEESALLKGSFDFMGMNYYSTQLIKHKPKLLGAETTYTTDQETEVHYEFPDGTPIGEQGGSEWLYVYPSGLYKLLKHNAETYGNPDVYITENGLDEKLDRKKTIIEAMQDDKRIEYHQDHLAFLKEAIEDGVNVKGYIVWSLIDNFEWVAGYSVRFGLYYVDYVNNLLRYPKNSAIWYMNFLNKKTALPSTKRQVINIEEAVDADNSAAKRKRR